MANVCGAGERLYPGGADRGLVGLLEAWRAGERGPGWRAAVRRWLGRHPKHRRTPVAKQELPSGFRRWWVRSRPDVRRQGIGAPSNADIVSDLLADHISIPGRSAVDWFDHGGATVIAGVPALAGEPYSTNPETLEAVAADLQRRFELPVAFDVIGNHHEMCGRLMMFFVTSIHSPSRRHKRLIHK